MKRLLFILILSSLSYSQTWNRFAEGTINLTSVDVTNLYSWGDSTYIMYDSVSYNPHITKMIPGQTWRRWGGYYDGTNDIMFTLGGGIGRLGNNILAIGGATANAVNGVSYNTYKYNWSGTTTQIAHSTTAGRGWTTFRPNADSAYTFDGTLNVSKTANGTSFTQLESGKTFRTLLGTSTGEYGQSMFFYNDTLWISLARNTFTEASTNPVADTGRVIYYVPAKGKYYVLDRSVTNDGSVLSIKWMVKYKSVLYVLVHSASDKKGLWKWNGSDFVQTDTPFDSTSSVMMAGMAGDNDKRLFISAGKYGVMDTTWNRIWEFKNGTWKKLNKVYSYNVSKSDSVVVSPLLHFNLNNNTLFAITPFNNSLPYLRVETHTTNQHKYYDAGSPAIWYADMGPVGQITVTSPTSSTCIKQNNTLHITWTSEGLSEFKVYFRQTATGSYSLLNTTTNNYYDWLITDSILTYDAKIKVTSTDGEIEDVSDDFTILPETYKLIQILEPTGKVNVGGYSTVKVKSINLSSFKFYYGLDTLNWNIVDTVTCDTTNFSPIDTTSFSWQVSSGANYIKVLENIDSTKYFAPRTNYVDAENRAPSQTGFQNPVWWSPPFILGGNYFTLSVKSVGFGWFGYSTGYLYKYNTLTKKWSFINSAGLYAQNPNVKNYDMPYPNGITYWYQGTVGDSIFNVTSEDFMSLKLQTGEYYLQAFVKMQNDSLLNLMGGINSLLYQDTISYNNRKYWYSSPDTSIYSKDLIHNITQKFASLKQFVGSTGLKYGYIKLYRISDRIFATNSSRQNNAVNYSFEVFPMNTEGIPVSDIQSIYSIVTRNYFRGIYPNAILTVIPKPGH